MSIMDELYQAIQSEEARVMKPLSARDKEPRTFIYVGTAGHRELLAALPPMPLRELCVDRTFMGRKIYHVVDDNFPRFKIHSHVVSAS